MSKIDLICRVHPYINNIPYYGVNVDIKMQNVTLDKITPEYIEKIKNEINIDKVIELIDSDTKRFSEWGIHVFIDESEENKIKTKIIDEDPENSPIEKRG